MSLTLTLYLDRMKRGEILIETGKVMFEFILHCTL